MKTILTLCLFGVVLCSSNLAQAYNWQVVYSQDFSSNPGWSTNDPCNFYWDQANGRYFIRNIKGTDQYAYIPITYSPDKSYKLSFDILLTRSDWAGYIFLGFMDADMYIQNPVQWVVSYHYVDAGKTAAMWCYDSFGHSYHPGQAQPAPFSLNTWYHNEAIFDVATGTFSLTVTNKNTGTLVGSQNLPGFTKFLDIVRLGCSNVNDRYAVGATSEGYIDNVVVSQSSTSGSEKLIFEKPYDFTVHYSGGSIPSGAPSTLPITVRLKGPDRIAANEPFNLILEVLPSNYDAVDAWTLNSAPVTITLPNTIGKLSNWPKQEIYYSMDWHEAEPPNVWLQGAAALISWTIDQSLNNLEYINKDLKPLSTGYSTMMDVYDAAHEIQENQKIDNKDKRWAIYDSENKYDTYVLPDNMGSGITFIGSVSAKRYTIPVEFTKANTIVKIDIIGLSLKKLLIKGDIYNSFQDTWGWVSVDDITIVADLAKLYGLGTTIIPDDTIHKFPTKEPKNLYFSRPYSAGISSEFRKTTDKLPVTIKILGPDKIIPYEPFNLTVEILPIQYAQSDSTQANRWSLQHAPLSLIVPAGTYCLADIPRQELYQMRGSSGAWNITETPDWWYGWSPVFGFALETGLSFIPVLGPMVDASKAAISLSIAIQKIDTATIDDRVRALNYQSQNDTYVFPDDHWSESMFSITTARKYTIPMYLKSPGVTNLYLDGLELKHEFVQATETASMGPLVIKLNLPELAKSGEIVLASHADLHVYDQQGRHMGVDYATKTIEQNVLGATFKIINADGNEVPYDGNTPDEGLRQVINLPVLDTGSYRIELFGTSNGPFHLTINGIQDGNSVTSKTYEGEIYSGEYLATTFTATATVGVLEFLYEPLAILPTFSLTPTNVEMVVEPNSIKEITFNVDEVGGQQTLHSVRIHCGDIAGSDGYIPGSQITFDNNNFDIAAGGQQIVTASIPIPAVFEGPCSGSIIVESLDGGAKSIVLTLITNRPPVANAGTDQTVYAWIDGVAEVNLDGAGSYDVDGDTLTYKWTWTIDGNTYDATGVKPTIELPVGQHVISLIVNDGTVDSEPNEVNITVVGPIEANLNITPEVLNCKSFMPKIMATLRLPKGITKDQIDSTEPLLLYPGEIEADWMWISRDFDFKCRAWNTTIFAWFDKDELMDAIPNNGQVALVVVGQLKTGQYFFGTDNIRVISPGNWPPHKPWWNCKWNRFCQRPDNYRH